MAEAIMTHPGTAAPTLPGNAFALVLRHGPLASQHARESIEAALALAAFGQDVILIFLDDGVFQLLPDQNAGAIAGKQISSMLNALELYDIEHVFVETESLAERGLESHSLAIEVTRVSRCHLAALLKQARHLISV
ncbi:sulfurtransferase complex subunit TusC [Pokkaliibacter sp. CJK22405]|uniref:sulfurtransferase complex subunit TusC n=1 Tax=Pokkaliibacter sp. CJK22405 TaxID=3384615 RepID=UPI0039852B56